MNLEDMNLEQVTKRIADLDTEVRNAKTVEAIEAATIEKADLVARKAELDDLETRKLTALNITAGTTTMKIVEERKESTDMEIEKMGKDELVASAEYRNAFLKNLMGQPLNEVEKRTTAAVASVDVSGAIPTITNNQIMTKLIQSAPLLSEITLLHVAGNVNFAVENANAAAGIHSETGEITGAADTLATISLAGFEICKLVRISASVKTMTVSSFESWLTDIIAANIAHAIENLLINGTGSSQPKGIDYAATWSDGSNGVNWGSTNPTYAELCELVSYLPGGYMRNGKFLMNHKTFWSQIQPIRDDSKYPVVSNDGGMYRVMGIPVLFSDYVRDGDMFLGDYKQIVANLAQDVTVRSSEHSGFKYNSIDYLGTAIFDSDIAFGTAFVKGADDLTAGA